MKNITKAIILTAAAALTALLLAGCQNQRKEEVKKTPAQAEAITDSTQKKDTMEAYYERMRRLKVLLKGAGRWENDR